MINNSFLWDVINHPYSGMRASFSEKSLNLCSCDNFHDVKNLHNFSIFYALKNLKIRKNPENSHACIPEVQYQNVQAQKCHFIPSIYEDVIIYPCPKFNHSSVEEAPEHMNFCKHGTAPKSWVNFTVSWHPFSNMASDWLAAQLPANQKLCQKTVVSCFGV